MHIVQMHMLRGGRCAVGYAVRQACLGIDVVGWRIDPRKSHIAPLCQPGIAALANRQHERPFTTATLNHFAHLGLLMGLDGLGWMEWAGP